MINEEKIRSDYSDNEKSFEKTLRDVEDSLNDLIKIFFKKTKFLAKIDNPRTKTLESCLKKIKRKDIACESFIEALEGKISIILNDFLGFRILCNTLEDVYQIAEIVKRHKRFT